MTNIRGVDPTNSPRPIGPSLITQAHQANPTSQLADDTVEISLQARIASKLAEIPPIRAGLVARVKAEIQAGTYETPEKLDVAIENLLKEL
ncbi:MAG: flagellar biosynthesis anti-sigma factor FlgM [Planctomycetes bacterium]|nr:flagellar biosynthesis anti-sigma factor FlgM [Planctomycetota bacterium]